MISMLIQIIRSNKIVLPGKMFQLSKVYRLQDRQNSINVSVHITCIYANDFYYTSFSTFINQLYSTGALENSYTCRIGKLVIALGYTPINSFIRLADVYEQLRWSSLSQPVVFAHREIFGLPIGRCRQTDQSNGRWRCSGRRRCGYPTWTTKKVDWMEYEREQQRGRRRLRKPERERSPRAWWCYPMSKGWPSDSAGSSASTTYPQPWDRTPPSDVSWCTPRTRSRRRRSAGGLSDPVQELWTIVCGWRPDANSVHEWQSTRRR